MTANTFEYFPLFISYLDFFGEWSVLSFAHCVTGYLTASDPSVWDRNIYRERLTLRRICSKYFSPSLRSALKIF